MWPFIKLHSQHRNLFEYQFRFQKGWHNGNYVIDVFLDSSKTLNICHFILPKEMFIHGFHRHVVLVTFVLWVARYRWCHPHHTWVCDASMEPTSNEITGAIVIEYITRFHRVLCKLNAKSPARGKQRTQIRLPFSFSVAVCQRKFWLCCITFMGSWSMFLRKNHDRKICRKILFIGHRVRTLSMTQYRLCINNYQGKEWQVNITFSVAEIHVYVQSPLMLLPYIFRRCDFLQSIEYYTYQCLFKMIIT